MNIACCFRFVITVALSALSSVISPLAVEAAQHAGHDGASEFEYGLDLILEGLKRAR